MKKTNLLNVRFARVLDDGEFEILYFGDPNIENVKVHLGTILEITLDQKSGSGFTVTFEN